MAHEEILAGRVYLIVTAQLYDGSWEARALEVDTPRVVGGLPTGSGESEDVAIARCRSAVTEG